MSNTGRVLRRWLGWAGRPIRFLRRRLSGRPSDVASDGEWIHAYVAGLRHIRPEKSLTALRLGSTVWLCREPHNPIDPGAVRVESASGRLIAYIPKELSADLAAYLELTDQPVLRASVTELSRDPFGKGGRLRICFRVPQGWLEAGDDYLQYHLERSPYPDKDYLLLTCSERTRDDIIRLLSQDGAKVDDWGECFRSAGNGRLYRYYIPFSLTEGLPEERAERLLRERYEIPPDRERDEALEKSLIYEELAIEEQKGKLELDEKVRILTEENESLRREREQALTQREAVERTARIDEGFMNKVCQTLLPDIEFVRDSLRVMCSGKRLGVLRDLYALQYSPESVRGERFESTGWYEQHLASAGRLYYRREGGRCRVLISEKKNQEKDTRYMKNH